jgi:murein DD-endopeptidase MepM/ murein hydrolase activator NlpD
MATPNSEPGPEASFWDVWLPRISWGFVVIVLALLVAVIVWRPDLAPDASVRSAAAQGGAPKIDPAVQNLHLADLSTDQGLTAIFRFANLHTDIPERASLDVQDYVVQSGDSLFGIAKSFNIKPDTILFSNYDTLTDNPDNLSIGQKLEIPPTDGVYYQWQAGNTLQGVADQFHADPQDILLWPGNHLNISNPDSIQPGKWVMIPGGSRPFHTWVVPIVARGRAGVLKNILGPGGCDVSGGAYGTGGFVWPAGNHRLSGNDFGPSHLGIDIAAGMGAAIYAADSGVVVYAGAISGGYGNMVMIDHGNGYQTLYAHLSQINVRCGQSVGQGQLIAYAGSTGNSTGPHLHFEVRYGGGFINPWTVLP